MTFLIGGFSAQQYKSYLISTSIENKKTFGLGHSIAHLHLSYFPTIAILVNRLAYFILHHFTVYPNNAYLFRKFKSHTFSQIKSQAEYDAVKEIFILFKHCPSFDSTQLTAIAIQLDVIEKLLKGEKKVKKEISVDEASKTPPQLAKNLLNDDEVEEDVSEDGSFASDDDVFDAEFDDESSEEQQQFLSPPSHFNPNEIIGLDALAQHKQSKIIKGLSTIDKSGAGNGSYLYGHEEDETDSDFGEVELQPTRLDAQFGKCCVGGEELETTVDDMHLIGNPEAEENELNSENRGDSVDAGIKWSPLPDYIVKIINKNFPYEDLNTIQDLFLKKNHPRLLDYQNDLKSLLKFENKLRVERIWTEDDLFQDCLNQYHQAFMKAYKEALKQTQNLHKKFVEKFSELPSKGENGEMICTIDQFKWVREVIATQFPAIYHLAFDASSLEIYQTRQLAALAYAIFFGSDAFALPAVDCLIYIKETIGKTTPILKFNSQNPLSKKNSFIHSQFIGPNGKIPTEPNELKKQLQGLAKSYVLDWLERDGVILEFGTTSIQSSDLLAKDWVRYMRACYTQTLKLMDSKQLYEEIQKAYNCPLIHLAAQAYVGELSDVTWATSTFPKAIMEKLFYHELQNAKEEEIRQGIQNLIHDACFEKSEDVGLLASRAGVSAAMVESLIRIRVFYIMCCLGQNAIEPVVRDLNRRVKNMHISAVNEMDEDSTLMCQSRERFLQFDNTFDALKITVKTEFKDPNKAHVLAKGHSVMRVNSISQYSKEKVEVDVIELQDLSFNLFSTVEHMRYLVAQIEPKTLVAYVKNFKDMVAQFSIYKKIQKYEEAKTEHNESRTLLQNMWNQNLFSSQSFQNGKADIVALQNVLQETKKIENILNAISILESIEQLSSNDQIDLEFFLKIIRERFRRISIALKEIYIEKNPQNSIHGLIHKKANQLEILANAAIKIVRSDSEESKQSSGRSTPLSNEDDSIIGQKVNSPKKSLFQKAFHFFIGETTEVKFIRWKIERYEDLILASQERIREYIESQSEWGSPAQFLIKAQQDDCPEWMNQILPLLKFCNKNLRIDEERMHPDYLEDVRKAYTHDMLLTLRNAAQWVKEFPHMPGTIHVNAICYQLYATVDINDRCERVFKTFLRLGENAMSKKREFIPGNPRYALIADLYNSHDKIRAVPFDAKAPILNQIGNSLKGHLNIDFDPNMQSNPMHVFCNRIIKRNEGEHIVKDIAMGSPTIENGIQAVKIAPEFEGMLRHYEKNGLVHLYVNNQNFIPKGILGGNEAPRCQALHDLAENHFKDTLYVITLNQNSSFYHQKYEISKQIVSLKGFQSEPEMDVKKVKEALIDDLLKGKAKDYLPSHLIKNETLQTWMKNELDKIHKGDFNECYEFINEEHREEFIQDFHNSLRTHVENWLEKFPAPNGETFGYSPCYSGANEFKNELMRQIFDGYRHETGNYIPSDLVKKFDLRNWSSMTINQIHKALFDDRKNLTVEERRIFIRLFYHNLARKILIETKANSSNVSCKDRIDRGAESDAEDFAYLAILANCMNESHVVDFFKMMIFSRAIIVRKRSIIDERLERLIETVRFMIDHQSELQALHQTLFPDIEITIDQFTPKVRNDEIDIGELE